MRRVLLALLSVMLGGSPEATLTAQDTSQASLTADVTPAAAVTAALWP